MPTGDSKLDAFASLFRSADKDVFSLHPPPLARVLLLIDEPLEGAQRLCREVEAYLSSVDSASSLEFVVIDRDQWVGKPTPPIALALKLIEEHQPDLVVTRRHQLGQLTQLPFTLGSVVDTLTQSISAPVLLLPGAEEPLPQGTSRVMVVTDHLSGDDKLVNMGVHFTHRQGTLFLAHIEDEGVLEYYLNAIDKMVSINSEVAREQLPKRLLKNASDYIHSVTEVLSECQIQETIVPLVALGRGVKAYEHLMVEHEIDLLIVNTKDSRQDAMDPMAHALAVELRSRPMLLL